MGPSFRDSRPVVTLVTDMAERIVKCGPSGAQNIVELISGVLRDISLACCSMHSNVSRISGYLSSAATRLALALAEARPAGSGRLVLPCCDRPRPTPRRWLRVARPHPAHHSEPWNFRRQKIEQVLWHPAGSGIYSERGHPAGYPFLYAQEARGDR